MEHEINRGIRTERVNIMTTYTANMPTSTQASATETTGSTMREKAILYTQIKMEIRELPRHLQQRAMKIAATFAPEQK